MSRSATRLLKMDTGVSYSLSGRFSDPEPTKETGIADGTIRRVGITCRCQ